LLRLTRNFYIISRFPFSLAIDQSIHIVTIMPESIKVKDKVVEEKPHGFEFGGP
jgi:hypothetical protein